MAVKTFAYGKELYKKYKPTLEKFFCGKTYPFIVALAVLIGHVSALELYLGVAVLLAAALSLVVCDTIKCIRIITGITDINRLSRLLK